jgi:hypothetical protein
VDRLAAAADAAGGGALALSFLVPEMSALILRSHSERNGVSKDVSGYSGACWSILRDAAARLLRMRAEGMSTGNAP